MCYLAAIYNSIPLFPLFAEVVKDLAVVFEVERPLDRMLAAKNASAEREVVSLANLT